MQSIKNGVDNSRLMIILHLVCPQSSLDLIVSMTLLSSILTVGDPYAVHGTGILTELECLVWNTRILLWGFFVSSTWNLVALTFER